MQTMTWQASNVRLIVATSCGRHFMCFHLTQEMRVFNVEDDVAGIICQALTQATTTTITTITTTTANWIQWVV
jgi:hypothetical protein